MPVGDAKAQIGEDQTGVGVDEPQPVVHHVQGDQCHLHGQHHAQQEHDENGQRPPDLQPRQGVGRQSLHENAQRHLDETDYQVVAHVVEQISLGEGVFEILPVQRFRQLEETEVGKEVLLGLQRRGHDGDHGRQPDHRQHDQDHIQHGSLYRMAHAQSSFVVAIMYGTTMTIIISTITMEMAAP